MMAACDIDDPRDTRKQRYSLLRKTEWVCAHVILGRVIENVIEEFVCSLIARNIPAISRVGVTCGENKYRSMQT